MKKSIVLILLIPILFMSCDGAFMTSLSDYSFDTYDGNLTLEEIQPNASFSPREDFATVVYDGCLWVMGGYDRSARGRDDSYREDVYKSSDGEHWVLVTDDAPWKGRRAFAAEVFEDSIYISGGFYVDEISGERGYVNDLWKTQDGVTWEEVAGDGPWDARMNHAMLSTDTGLYIFGGFCQDGEGPHYLSDMWKYDGTEWAELTDDVPYGGRASFAYCKAGDYFYLQGGAFEGMTQSGWGRVDESVPAWSALWRFNPDNEADENTGWESTWKVPSNNSNTRSEHALICYHDKIWLLSGKCNSSLEFSNNPKTYSTLYYSDGNAVDDESSWDRGFSTYAWTQDSYGGIVEPIYGYECEVFNDTLMLIGGYASDGPQDAVWQITESEDN